MTKNVGTIDAGIRAVIAGALIFLAAIYNNRPLPAIALAVLALALLTTALNRYCPLYSLFGTDRNSPREMTPSGS